MAGFVIDRQDLPKPWADPLVFVLRNSEGISVTAQIERSAAIEYQNAGRGGIFALLLARQRTEDFVQSVEEAIERLVDANALDSRQVTLSWDDLNP